MEQKLKALLSDMAVKPVPPRAPKPHKGSEPKPSATTTPNAGTSNGSDRQPTMDSGNLRIKHCRHGMMMFHTNDTYIGRSLDLYGEFSEGETEIFQQLLRPGMTVVDAGANIGAHTLYFARAVGQTGRVLAFEPQRVLYQMLCGNIALNGLRNVRAENAALGAEAGTLLVPQLDYTKGGNFGGVPLGEWKHGEEIPVRTLDSYVLSSCHLIKIDVEGMERVVLEGAADVLKTHKPFLYVENDRREKSKALIEWLLSKGYRLYWHTPPLFNPNNHFGEKKNVFAKTVSRNMLCVPRNKALKSPLQEITSPDVNWRGPRNPNKTDQ
jgi:FkbM family methyltransferase